MFFLRAAALEDSVQRHSGKERERSLFSTHTVQWGECDWSLFPKGKLAGRTWLRSQSKSSPERDGTKETKGIQKKASKNSAMTTVRRQPDNPHVEEHQGIREERTGGQARDNNAVRLLVSKQQRKREGAQNKKKDWNIFKSRDTTQQPYPSRDGHRLEVSREGQTRDCALPPRGGAQEE